MAEPSHSEIMQAIGLVNTRLGSFETHLGYMRQGIDANGKAASKANEELARVNERLNAIHKEDLPRRVTNLEKWVERFRGASFGVKAGLVLAAGGVGAGMTEILKWIGKGVN